MKQLKINFILKIIWILTKFAFFVSFPIQSFIKKYIHYAKTQVAPVLTQEASDYIASRYSELRTREDGTQDKYRVGFLLFVILKVD